MSKLNVDNIENRLGTGGPQLPGATFTDNIVGTAASFTGDIVGTAASFTGIVTATSFTGDIVGTAASFTGIVTATSFTGNVTGDATGLTGNPSISVTDITATGNVSIAGTLTYEDVTNVDSIGIITARNGIDVTGGDINVGTATTITDGGINVTGAITATSFSGDGSSVTNVNATTLDTIDSGSFLRSDAADTKTSGNLIFNDNIQAQFGTGSDLQIYHNGSNSYIDDGSGTGALIFKSNLYSFRNAADSEQIASFNENGSVELYYNNFKKLETTTTGVTVTGTVSDSIGPLRRLGITAVSATGNLSANDAGKLLRSTGTITLTIPSGTFTAGDMISIFNVGTGTITIAQGSSTTLYNSADASTGNRTLDAKGIATIACTASNEFVISGSGLN